VSGRPVCLGRCAAAREPLGSGAEEQPRTRRTCSRTACTCMRCRAALWRPHPRTPDLCSNPSSGRHAPLAEQQQTTQQAPHDTHALLPAPLAAHPSTPPPPPCPAATTATRRAPTSSTAPRPSAAAARARSPRCRSTSGQT
jgi:hypothetical protein